MIDGWDLAECGWNLVELWMRLAEWLERLTANAEVATVQGSIPASSDTVESEGRMKQCWTSTKKNPTLKITLPISATVK
jgi:hypothetical protein